MKRFNFGKRKEEEEAKGIAPFGEFELFEGLGLETLVENFFNRHLGFGLTQGLKELKVDVFERDDKVVVKAELPGLDKKDIQLSLDNNILTISAKKTAEREVKKDNYYYLERSSGNIQRAVRLPDGVKTEGVKAGYKDGVLNIEINRDKESQKGRDINIE